MTDLKNYHELCLRTEADDHAMQSARILECNGILVNLLVSFCDTAGGLDVLKKHVYYGKPLSDRDKAIKDSIPGELDSVQRQRLSERIRLVHGIIGMITECGELVDQLMNHIAAGETLDQVNILEECCDVDWYKNLCLDAAGYTAADVPTTLIPKLEVRYAKKQFNAKQAIERDLSAERASLEANATGDKEKTQGN